MYLTTPRDSSSMKGRAVFSEVSERVQKRKDHLECRTNVLGAREEKKGEMKVYYPSDKR